jgi:hypothetical protein
MLSLSQEKCALVSVDLSSAVITDVEIDQMHVPVLSRYFLNKQEKFACATSSTRNSWGFC